MTLWKAAVMRLMLTGARTVTDSLAEILELTLAAALPPVSAVAPLSCCCSAGLLLQSAQLPGLPPLLSLLPHRHCRRLLAPHLTFVISAAPLAQI